MNSKALLIIIVVVAFAEVAILTLTSPYPNMRDAWFHMLVARAWWKGDNGMTCPAVMDINLIPYPPVYHLLMAPFAYSVNAIMDVQKVAQVLFYPLGLLAVMLATHEGNWRRTATVGALLFGTYFAFSMMQSRPQNLAMLLFAVVFYATLKDKKWLWIGAAVTMFYVYSPYAFAFVLGPAVYLLRRNKRDPRVWLSLLLVLPMLLYQASFMVHPRFIERWVAHGDYALWMENSQLAANPVYWLLSGMGVSVAGLALMYREIEHMGTARNSAMDTLMVYCYFGFLILIPVWFARTLTLVIVPACYVTAKYVDRVSGWQRGLVLAVLAGQMVLFALSPVWWMSPMPADAMAAYW